MEADRDIGTYRRAFNLARGRIDSGRHVQRHNRSTDGFDGVDQRGGTGPRHSRKPRSQESVDDHIRAPHAALQTRRRDPLVHGHIEPPGDLEVQRARRP